MIVHCPEIVKSKVFAGERPLSSERTLCIFFFSLILGNSLKNNSGMVVEGK